MRITLLTASARADGNSRLLAEAFTAGAREAGHHVTAVDLNDTVDGFLRDCRVCRRADGSCSIDDGYRDLVLDEVITADAVVYATPLYFYGVAGVLKTYLDRLVCYMSASHPRSADVIAGLRGQRSALLISSEEDYPSLLTPAVTQLTEFCRYLHQEFVGVVHGVGNTRGEVVRDPADPIAAARRLGAQLADRRYSDYAVTTDRANTVWPSTADSASHSVLG